MVLHVVPLAKLNYLLFSPSHTTLTPVLASLIFPFLLKFSFSFKLIRRAYIDLLHASRLFVFQLRQIVFDAETAQLGNNNNGSAASTRWQRALRLVCQRITHVRRSPPTLSDEDNFHTLTLLSL